jgi:SAM-dependent methyltransferase
MGITSKIANLPYIKNLVPHKTLKEVQEYWKSPNDEVNLPHTYLKGEERSKFLVDIFDEHNIDKQSRILEIGCNVGRNLNFLFQAGYKNLNGVEINPEAVELMKNKYPEMVKHAHIYNSTIEEKIKQLDDSSFDIVFTMAVLVHIHTDSEFIFSEMVRITKNYLITIEIEKGIAKKNFERNYKLIFEKLGMKEIKNINCSGLAYFEGHVIARIFSKQSK